MSYPSTTLVNIKDKLKKLNEEASRSDIETEVRRADLDLLDKINKVQESIPSSATFKLPPSATAYTQFLEYEYTPTFTSFGTCTGINFTWTRVGNRIKIMGQFKSGVSTAAEARISLPGSIVSDTSLVPSLQVCGIWARDTSTGALGTPMLIQSGVNYVTFGFQSAGNPSLQTRFGNVLTISGEIMSVQFEIPISGWNS